MGKKKSTFINMTVTLFVITIVAGVSLGFINDITKGPKAQAKLERKINALKSVLPEFNNNPVESVKRVKSDLAKDSIEIYTAYMDNKQTGTAVVGSSEKGYGGLVKVMVGFNPDGSIKNITVLEQKETPGLGTKMKDEKFIRQFRGKHPSVFNLKVRKDQGDVDALTGATITTRAFTEATQMAYDVFVENQTQPKN
ncbi:MAG: RnfABCDGE type electron transport complex subunit G [Bacteroidia bacterium]|nr:RnfABCDGE type electron transport complex subunit G [Bacteroidia bacterium]NNF32086.1 RnfABCDGE type electron transport complex subunit G [Flavobacteriaceae bacterium]MBT8275125.1 RnfABCDGE type electron transport complex subunit G [Bacteroidia bacterium]NNJ82264.1 RnfABCDGE type electron transport complex subunit G [Flavobacteriaceae bacterium]NNK54950.1 RnfABCDGE type electron transport complex subunit G [Flavobacteriaceae bacterium]